MNRCVSILRSLVSPSSGAVYGVFCFLSKQFVYLPLNFDALRIVYPSVPVFEGTQVPITMHSSFCLFYGRFLLRYSRAD